MTLLPSIFTTHLHGGKEHLCGLEKARYFSPLGNKLVLYSLRIQGKDETLETSSSTSLISEMREKLKGRKGLTQGHTAREVKQDQSLAGKSEYTHSILLC